jgi:hypothetical protein
MGNAADDRLNERDKGEQPVTYTLYPRYLVVVDHIAHFMPMRDAATALCLGWHHVVHRDLVLDDETFRVREITSAEKAEMRRMADELSPARE